MGTRGRKSAAEMAVVVPIHGSRWPSAPGELTDEQKRVWDTVVQHLPADWFPRETHGLLAQYCRHVVSARRIAELIQELLNRDGFTLRDYDRLLKMQEREGRAIASLATKLRITQQARLRPETAARRGDRGPHGPLPWDIRSYNEASE
jgi:hypothetical protein